MDDIIEVNGKIYLVEEIKFRTTTVIGRDENYVILPNSELTRNNVVNWTYNKKASHFQIDLGVDYATNVPELMELFYKYPNHLFVLQIMVSRRSDLGSISIHTIFLGQNTSKA